MKSSLLFCIVFVGGLVLSTNLCPKGGGFTKFVTAIFSGKLLKKRKPAVSQPLIQQQQEEPKKLEEQKSDRLNDSSTFGVLKRVSTQSDGDYMEISFKKNKFDKGKKPKSLGGTFSKKEQEQFERDLDKIIEEINREAKKKDNL